MTRFVHSTLARRSGEQTPRLAEQVEHHTLPRSRKKDGQGGLIKQQETEKGKIEEIESWAASDDRRQDGQGRALVADCLLLRGHRGPAHRQSNAWSQGHDSFRVKVLPCPLSLYPHQAAWHGQAPACAAHGVARHEIDKTLRLPSGRPGFLTACHFSHSTLCHDCLTAN